MTPPVQPVVDRLRHAAFELFAEAGYDATSVDAIAQRAGVGRTTFFRTFATKEAVIFPDHDALLGQVDARLAATGADSRQLALAEASGLVLRHYLDEGDLARSRYRLTRSVPALREREAAGMQRYQQVFRTHLRAWSSEPDGLLGELHAELMAGAVVTGHNLVLRRWLRGLTDAPETELTEVMAEIGRLIRHDREAPSTAGGHVVVLGPDTDLDRALDVVRRTLTRT